MIPRDREEEEDEGRMILWWRAGAGAGGTRVWNCKTEEDLGRF